MLAIQRTIQLIFIIICLIERNSATEFESIFSPSPSHVTSLQRIEDTMQQLVVIDKYRLLFLSIGEQGLIILDQDTLQILAEIKDKGQIDYFAATSDGEYLFFPYQERISTFLLSKQPYTLQLLCQDTTERGKYVERLYLFNNEEWAAGASMQQIIVYDIRQKQRMEIIGELDVQMNPFYIIYQVSNHLFIANMELKIIRYKQQDNQNVTMSVVFKIPADYAYSSLVITQDNKFIYALDTWAGMYFGKFIPLDDIQDGTLKQDFVFDVKNWWPTNQSPLPNEIKMTQDEKFIIVGVQQLGLYVFDISNRESDIYPKLFQWIRSPGYSFSIKLSKDENYLYYVNGIKLQIYGRVQPNLNNEYPNLFNVVQANFTEVGTNIYRWRCYITKDDEYFMGSFDKDGLFIFDLKSNPYNLIQRQHVVPQNIYYTESALIDEDGGYIITPGDSAGVLLFVYSISQIRQNTPILPAATLTYTDTSVVMEGVRFSFDKKYIGIAAYSNLFLIDYSKGALNLSIISTITFNSEVVELVFSKNNQYILTAQRNFGFICVEIDENKNLKQISHLKTSGGFSIIQSLDWSYAFVSEGAKGIGIIDLNQLPQIIFISRISVQGTTMHITPIKNDTFLLVSSNVEGFLTLIDARDRSNLSIMSQFLVEGQNGLASCVNQNQTYTFLTNSQGITSLPLISRIQVHTEIFLVQGKETNKITFQRQLPNQILLLGQTFQFQFYQIYPENGARLTNIFYYQNFQIASLPYWIIFNQQIAAVNLQCVKDALGVDVTVPAQNTIVLEHKIPLTSQSFQFDTPTDDGVIIIEELSKQIYKQLRLMQILNFENLLNTNNFERSETFRFRDETMNDNQPVLDKVKRILQQSIYYNPVMFQMASSLRFFNEPQEVKEFESEDAQNGNQKYFVFSIQSSVQMYIEVNRGDGKFVDIYYDGVIAQISNFETHLKIEGTVTNINNVLKQGILFFMESTQGIDQVQMRIILQDGVNYDLQTTLQLSQALMFITLKKPVVLNQSKKLQSQFNQMFSSGSVSIQDNLSFEFSKDTFINEDTNVLNYKASFKQGDQYVDSVSGAWIQQSSNSLRFFGVVPVEEYRTIVRVRIDASDGYTTATDTFSIYVYSIPFIYIFSTLIKVFGPILTVIGVYRYRSYFFNFAFHKKNVYRQENIEVLSNYYKKITIVADQNIKAILFFKALLSKTPQIKAHLKQNVPNFENINLNEVHSPETDPYCRQNQAANKNNNQTLVRLDDQQFQPSIDHLLSTVFQDNDEIDYNQQNNEATTFMKDRLQSDPKIKSILQQFVDYLKECQKDQKQSQKSSKQADNNLIDEENKANQNQLQDKHKPLHSFNLKCNQNDFFTQYFLNENGSVKMKFIIKLMIDLQIQIKHQNQNISVKSIVPELIDPTSRLYQSLKAIVSRHFLKQNPLLLLIYKFLKKSAKLESIIETKCQKDWYLKYIRMMPEEQENEQKMLSFPKIQLLIEPIKSQIKTMMLILQNDQEFNIQHQNILRKSNFPFKLLFNVIIADSLGLLDHEPSIFVPSQGESIHQNFFEINSVQAYKKVEHLQCSLVRRFLKLDMMNYGSSKNQQLPSWMKFTLKSNAIILSGIPKIQDVETFIIRIYDVSDYIIRQFEIQIQKPVDSSPINIQKLNDLRDEDIQEDGIVSPTDTPVISERIKYPNINANVVSELFFSSHTLNQDQIKSQHNLEQNSQAKKTLNSYRDDDSPFVQQVLINDFNSKNK